MKDVTVVSGGAGFIGCALATRLGEAAGPLEATDNLLPQVHPDGGHPATLPGFVDLQTAKGYIA